MRLKPGVLQWAAVACFCVGLIYALGLEGSAQIGQLSTAVRAATARSTAPTPVTPNTLPCRSTAAAGTHERRTHDVQR